ncbi:MAG: hypothetical protein V2A54_13255 [Bacteroidota bacterium]
MSNRFDIQSITSGYRPIRDGRQYTQLFGLPNVNDKVILKDAEVEETVDLMKKVVWKYLDDTKKIAPYLKGKTVEETCRNIWNFLYHHIQYKLDKKGLEELRRPARSWWERQTGIDCDCFSIFVSSILTNLKIPHQFRITRYDLDSFQHVYVIVPTGNSAGHYIIDCVLSRFNLEKPFSEKKDFTMSLNGINVAVLSGVVPNVMELVNDLDGLENLGAESNEERLQAIYAHLVKTRNMVAQKPGLIRDVDYPPAFLKMLDYAIVNWNTNNRDKALAILAKNEDAFNEHFGLEDIPENSDLEGLENDWEELDGMNDEEIYQELNGKKRKEKKQEKKQKKEEKKQTKKEKKPGKKGFFKKIGTAVKKGGKAFIRYNPVTISARNGFLLAMKLNIKKMASKLKWAYITYVEAKTHGVLEEDWKKSVVALNKIEKLFVDKLQGKKDKLKSAIINGKSGGLKGTESEILLGQIGVAPVAGAALIAAAPVLLAAAKIMSDAGLFKKGEEAGLEDELNQNSADAEKLMDDPEFTDDGSSPSPENTPDDGGDETTGGIWGFVKQNPLIVAGGAGLVIWGVSALVSSAKKKKEKKKEGQLSGTQTQAAKKKTQQKRKTRKAKIDAIRLK